MSLASHSIGKALWTDRGKTHLTAQRGQPVRVGKALHGRLVGGKVAAQAGLGVRPQRDKRLHRGAARGRGKEPGRLLGANVPGYRVKPQRRDDQHARLAGPLAQFQLHALDKLCAGAVRPVA